MISLCDCLLVSIKLFFLLSFHLVNVVTRWDFIIYLFIKKYKLSYSYMVPRRGFEISRVYVLSRTLPIPALMHYIHMKGTL